ncbi:MAG: methyltransferase domain-containing protein [Bryobacterales bacterium]|nr:methyltransferase domain-containing protein [Bryobacterales bacterium]
MILYFDGTTLKQPITRYTKVKEAYSWYLRNCVRAAQKPRRPNLKLLHVGCGSNIYDNFINLDYSWQSGIDICYDITKGIPLPTGSMEGVYTEHCLEHISFEACAFVLSEFRRVLATGGMLRVVVPDAELFVELYRNSRRGVPVSFPYEQRYPQYTAMMHMNRIFRDHGHLYAYDFETMKRQLEDSGFRHVVRSSFREGGRPELLIDSEYRACESMYIEAVAE